MKSESKKKIKPILINKTFFPGIFVFEEMELDKELQQGASVVAIPNGQWKRNEFLRKWAISSKRLTKNGKFTY